MGRVDVVIVDAAVVPETVREICPGVPSCGARTMEEERLSDKVLPEPPPLEEPEPHAAQ